MKKTERKSGILMPVSALPGRYGIGTLGKNARGFADFLKAAGQKWLDTMNDGTANQEASRAYIAELEASEIGELIEKV